MTIPQGFDYGKLMQRALRGLMADVLKRVAEEGLPGDHHFYIGFDTTHPGVDMPAWLREHHPEEIVIVIQHEFSDLAVTLERFTVRLNFSNQPAKLVVPFEAVRTFIDPSIEFGLNFDARKAGDAAPASIPTEAREPKNDGGGEASGNEEGAEVIRLDTFRNP